VALCPLIYLLFKNKYIGAVILLLFLLNDRFRWIGIPLGGYVYYLTGAYISTALKNVEFYRNKLLTALGWIFLITIFVLRFRFLGNTIVNLVFFFSTWVALDIFKNARDYPWWMKITFFTYVAHDLLLEMLEKVVLLIWGKRTIFALLDYIFAPIIVFILLVAIAAFMRRFIPKIWNVITGER
jgi:hypothetical protein